VVKGTYCLGYTDQETKCDHLLLGFDEPAAHGHDTPTHDGTRQEERGRDLGKNETGGDLHRDITVATHSEHDDQNAENTLTYPTNMAKMALL
jgi:hypothetical protein